MRDPSVVAIARELVLSAARDSRAARRAEGDAMRRYGSRQINLDALIASVRASALAEACTAHLTETLAAMQAGLS